MSRKKKCGRHINYYIEKDIYDEFEKYAESQGQTMTTALERILRHYFEEMAKRNKE